MIISKNDRDGSFRPGQAYRKERAILEVFPLDSYTESPAMLMRKMDCDKELGIPIWDKYMESVARHDPRGAEAVGFHARFDFVMRREPATARSRPARPRYTQTSYF